MKKHLRMFVQALSTLSFNLNLTGFLNKTLYKGSLKKLCVPVLNCYSCPGAVGSCPIGALQSQLARPGKSFSFYVCGTLVIFGVLFGRLICGFLCPFGWLQEILHKLPTKKLRLSKKLDKPLRKLKYLLLAVFVVLLPLFLTNSIGAGQPYFCKLICPVGTLEGGIPLVLTSEQLQAQVGELFFLKVMMLFLTIFFAVVISRPFCKYVCPLGAIYSLFNSFSFYTMRIDLSKCTGCKACAHHCPMDIDPTLNPNSPECIRCGICKSHCPNMALTTMFSLKPISPQTRFDIKL